MGGTTAYNRAQGGLPCDSNKTLLKLNSVNWRLANVNYKRQQHSFGGTGHQTFFKINEKFMRKSPNEINFNFFKTRKIQQKSQVFCESF